MGIKGTELIPKIDPYNLIAFDIFGLKILRFVVLAYFTGIYSSQCTSFLTEPPILAFDN